MSRYEMPAYVRDFIYQVGTRCKEFRKNLGYTSTQVASDLKLKKCNVVSFENGYNNSMYILSWYLERGFKL